MKKVQPEVKPGEEKKFLYIREYPFGDKKLPLVLVDFDPKCKALLTEKQKHSLTDEGTVSLTKDGELNFEGTKRNLKRSQLQEYFKKMGGLLPVFVPKEEQEADLKTKESNEQFARSQLLDRISRVGALQYPPELEKLKTRALAEAKVLLEANRFKEAFQLLDKLAAKAVLPGAGGGPGVAAEPVMGRPGEIDLGALRWNLWFRATPLWPELLTKAAWDKNKSVLAKMALSTGVGSQLKKCEEAFQAATATMPFIRAVTAEGEAKSIKTCQAFMSGAALKTLHESLKELRDLAKRAAAECQNSKLISKATTQLCTDIANAADVLMVSCNPNSLSGCISEALKRAKADALEAESDPMRQWGVDQAKAAYAAQMKGEVHTGDANTPAYNPGNKFEPKNLEQKDLIFQNATVQDLMKRTGLTEGEVLAIRAYTASNYTYINPATANQKDKAEKSADWMDSTNKPDPSKAKTPEEKRQLEADLERYLKGTAQDKGSKKSLYEEGALHAGMIMEAFKKLPKYSDKLYRGARMTAQAFQKAYQEGGALDWEAFSSTSCSEEVARGFANGAGDKIPPADATTSVFVEAQITDGRDLRELSVYGAAEAEVLVPPGTKLKVEKIYDYPTGDSGVEGVPPAKQWKKVLLKQLVK